MSIECYSTDCAHHNKTEPFCDAPKCEFRFDWNAGFNHKLMEFRTRKILEFIGQYLEGKTILELGFGNGFLLQKLAEKCLSIVGVDRDFDPFPGMIDISSDREIMFRKNNMILIKKPVEDIVISEKAFDYIIAAGLLEHLEDPIAVLKKYREYLKDDGFFIATVPNVESVHRRIGVKMRIILDLYDLSSIDIAVGHKRYYDSYSLMEDFATAGYITRKIGGFLLKPFPNNKMGDLSDEMVEAFYTVGKSLHYTTLAELTIIAKKGVIA